MGAICGVYGFFYMESYWSRRAAGPPAFFFNLMLASMLLVLLAREAVVLLVAWEIMTLTSYVLVTFEHEEAEVRRAGWVYLIAGHIGVASLIAFFLVLGRHAGGLGFAELAATPAGGGFGVLVFLARRLSASASRPASCRFTSGCPRRTRPRPRTSRR